MSTEDQESFQSSSKCWICDKLVDVGDHPLGGDWCKGKCYTK